MLQKMFCYVTGPIDDWEGVHTRPSIARELEQRSLTEESLEAIALHSQLDRILGACLAVFRQLGWEGDFSEGPAFFQLPDPETLSFRWGLVVKQANNGRCFIASPFSFCHLEEDAHLDTYVEL